MVDIELISAGSYKVLTPHPEGTEYKIISTGGWEGPRGGMYSRWESAYKDRYGYSCIESECLPRATLREAREELADFFASLTAS